MSVPKAQPDSTDPKPAISTDVFAVGGVEPEVLAYAMAKYSRSALSMKESLREISESQAEKFLNTFYFQYGHRSIADLAHIAMAIERLSLLAAIAVVDEQRWDGQERSTRYQDFAHPDYFIPAFADERSRAVYTETIEFLFAEYRHISEESFRYLCGITPRPAEMKVEQYERTLRARAFDIARYLLPLATNTSLGQIVNARTLENQIARLLTSPFDEVRQLAGKMKSAAKTGGYTPSVEKLTALIDEVGKTREDLAADLRALLLKELRMAPTLVKYAEANHYHAEARRELEAAAESIMGDAPIRRAPAVDLLEDEPVEIELATTLLYEHCWYPYRQVRERVEALSVAERAEIIDLGVKHRGAHDELLRAYSGGYGFRFDILMDIGGYRDLHRHRRCVQIAQAFTAAHGYETPSEISAAQLLGRYSAAMQRVPSAIGQLISAFAGSGGVNQSDVVYLLPLAYRKRTLFKMDFAEVVYISELRTGPAGHWSYRKIAYEMYEAVTKRHPALAKHFRVTNVHEPVDLLKR